MKYFKIHDHPKNNSKIDSSISPKSALEFRKRISGTKIYLKSFWFCEKSFKIIKNI